MPFHVAEFEDADFDLHQRPLALADSAAPIKTLIEHAKRFYLMSAGVAEKLIQHANAQLKAKPSASQKKRLNESVQAYLDGAADALSNLEDSTASAKMAAYRATSFQNKQVEKRINKLVDTCRTIAAFDHGGFPDQFAMQEAFEDLSAGFFHATQKVAELALACKDNGTTGNDVSPPMASPPVSAAPAAVAPAAASAAAAISLFRIDGNDVFVSGELVPLNLSQEKHREAIQFLGTLAFNWQTSKEICEKSGIGPGVRLDRLKASLPVRVRKLIDSSTNKGYRLKPPLRP